VAAGTALAPMSVAFLAASLVAPRLVVRHGGRVVTAGLLVQAVGLLGVAGTALTQWSHLGVLTLLPAAVVMGIGQGMTMSTVFRIVLSKVPPESAGVGSGVMVTTQQAAFALGVATLGTLLLSLAPSTGMRNALVVAVLVQLTASAGALVLSLRLPRAVG